MTTWRECPETGDAIVEHEGEDGEVIPIRVPWEHRATALGWGRRPRAKWKHPAAGVDMQGVIVSEGRHGVLAVDETGSTHLLPHQSFQLQEWPKRKVQSLAKAKVWVNPHMRAGSHVDGHWRDGPEELVFTPELHAIALADTQRSPATYTLEGDAGGVVPGRLRELDRDLASGFTKLENLKADYNTTREHIRRVHGDHVTLYRADAPDAEHHPDIRTVYYGDRAMAERFANGGRTALPYSMPVDDILALYAKPSGYMEVIAPPPQRDMHKAADLKLTAGTGGGKSSGSKPIPAGARWITVHPNGPGSEGNAILIVPAGDGTHRVIGGAGGSMNHLRLKGVKSEGEMKEHAARKRAEKAEARKGMTKEQREAEKADDEAKKARLTAAEKKVIKTVREQRGGIDKDLTEEDTAGLSEAAAAKLHRQHHRQQLAQAMKARRDIAERLVSERVEQIEDEAAVDATLAEDPDLWTEAHAMGERELALIEAEDESRKEARRPTSNRADSEERNASVVATARDVLSKIDRDEAADNLAKHGGRADPTGALPAVVGETASEEQRRRAAVAVENALILADAAGGKEPAGDTVRASLEFDVIRDALEAAGVDGATATRDEVRAALANEAAIQLQRAQLAAIKANKFESMEREGKASQAMKAMVHTDVVRGLTEEVRDATKKLGLREDAKTPLRQAEVAELMNVLGSFEELRAAKKGLESTVAEVEKVTKHDVSRRAFNLAIGEPPGHVIEGVEEQVMRELATRIVGMADTHSSDHAKAVADGHYAKLADISMAVSNQSHVDRTVVDAIGLKNSTVLLRHALESQGHDPDAMHDALVGHHVREQKKLTADALRLADAFVPDMEETINDVGDIHHAMRKLDASEADIAAAQRAIGSALGQMESTATMAQAFRGKNPEHLSIELKDSGTSSLAGHLTWLASTGLHPEDYEVDTANKEIRIPKASWDKLIRTESAEVVDQRKLAHAIKRGEHDEDGWMPAGMVSRSSTSFTDPPVDAPRYHQPLDLHADDIHTGLADHIGSRLADGERPADIARDLLSPTVAGKSPDPEAFSEMVRSHFPIATDEDRAQEAENVRIRRERGALVDEYNAAKTSGDADKVQHLATQIAAMPKAKPVEAKRDTHFAAHYEKMAADYLKRHHPDASPLHAASMHQPGVSDEQVTEAVFRTLAANPEHAAAFTPIGQLQPKHRQALRDHFYKRAGIAQTRDYSEEFKGRTSELVDDIKSGKVGGDSSKALEAAGQGGMFGAPAPVAKSESLHPGNLGTLHPAEAKALAYEYPREGAELHRQAMGERPAEPTTPSKLKPEVQAAIDHVRTTKPSLSPPELAKAAATHMGRQRALKELGATEEDAKKRDPVTGELTPEARRLGGKLEVRAAELAERGIDPREVQRSYGHLIHDAEGAEFDAYRKRNSTPWDQFVGMHGDLGTALQALQEEMKGEFAGKLAEHYSKVTGKALQTTIAEIPNADLHAQALASPKERRDLAAARREEVRKHQGRSAAGDVDEEGKKVGGKYQAGSALERYRAAKDAERSHSQRQSGLFGAAPPAPGKLVSTEATPKRAPGAGERAALGRRVESEVQSIVGGNVGRNLDLKKKVRLFPGASMDGRRVDQQRVIKMLRSNGGRLGAWLGTGSGKTPTSIGAFTDLHSTGDTTHGLFLVPTAVQSQFGEEMSSFVKPGQFVHESGDGKSHHERAAMLADKGVHMRVLTHESAARTALKMTADHHGVAPEAMLEQLRGMDDHKRARTVRTAMKAAGVPRHMVYIDEAHRLTTRQGEQESDMSIMLGALAHPANATHLLAGTATPHKNDTTEVYSMARLLDPHRYSDAYRFTQSYGVGSVAAPDAVRRELDHRTYTASIPPDGVSRIDTANPMIGPDGKKTPSGPIPLTPKHRKAVDKVTAAYESATKAYADGGADVEATKLLSPERFAAAPAEQHEAIARELAPSLGIVKETAVRKALQLAPVEHNAKLRRMVDTVHHDVKAGKPSIVFTDSLEEAKHVHQTLVDEGLAAGVYHGGLDGKARDKFRAAFDSGQIQVGVMTSAGEAGINMQSGKIVHHYDVPKTAKSWSQRNGRAFRQGQKDNVDVHDWSHEHEHDSNATRRLQDKSRLADVFQTPLGPMDEHGFARDYHATLNKRHQGFDPDAMAAK